MVDKYEDVLVVECLALGMEQFKETIVSLLKGVLKEDGISIRGVYERSDANERRKEGLPKVKGFIGETFDTEVEITENGVHYLVDVVNGQKTGFFLDQKYNRLAMQRICKGKRVLDCFTHMGTFALIHTDTALGIIPCGSGNGLARHLQIPLEPKAAIDIINESSVACIDYGKINNIPFFCTCGVGFDAFVSLKFADSGKRGLLTYLENTLHESLSYKPETYEIENEEGTVKYKAFLIACGNASQYGNNAYIAPQASLTDGLMDVTILEPFTVLDVPSLSFQLFNKTIDQNSRIKTFRTKKIKIHRSKPGVMHYDGDPIMGGKDIEVELIPHGLNIIVSDKKKENEPFSLLQQISEIFSGMKPKAETFAFRHSHLFELNKSLLRRLSKKQ